MYVTWLLEFVWRIFIQGPLMVIGVMTEVIKAIFGLQFISVIQPNGSKDVALSYLLSATFVIGMCLVVFIFQFIIIFISEKGLMKSRIINSSKRLGSSLLLLIIIPLGMFLFSIIFDQILIIFNKFWGSSSESAGAGFGKSLALLLYDAGYWGEVSNIKPPAVSGDIWGPPSNDNLMKYNFILQIFLVNFTMILLLYFAWNFLQKIIEIFILYITYPFALLASIGTESISSKIWLKEILNKITLALLTIFMFSMFSIFILAVDNKLIGSSATTNVKTNKVIFAVLLTAFGFATISTNIFVSKLFYQHAGFFGTIKSAKQTLNFSNKYMGKTNNFKEEEFAPKINELESKNSNLENGFIKSIKTSQKNSYYKKESTINQARIFK